MIRFSRVFAFAAVLAATDSTLAQEALVGDVVLTITGSVEAGHVGQPILLDRDMLRAMPATSFSTTTIWTDGAQAFVGVELAALVKELGLAGSGLRVKALNDYVVDIPMSDAVAGGPILAYEQNGRELSIREKGPLWIVYPFDQNRDYQTEVIYTRSIWQVDRIEVLP